MHFVRAGWAHCQKNQHTELSTSIQDFIAQCWRTGEESNVEGSAVNSRLIKYLLRKCKLNLHHSIQMDWCCFLKSLRSVKFEQCTKQIRQHKHPEHELRKRS